MSSWKNSIEFYPDHNIRGVQQYISSWGAEMFLIGYIYNKTRRVCEYHFKANWRTRLRAPRPTVGPRSYFVCLLGRSKYLILLLSLLVIATLVYVGRILEYDTSDGGDDAGGGRQRHIPV